MNIRGLLIFTAAIALFLPYCALCVITGRDWLKVWDDAS